MAQHLYPVFAMIQESSVFLQASGLIALSACGTAATMELFYAGCQLTSVCWVHVFFSLSYFVGGNPPVDFL